MATLADSAIELIEPIDPTAPAPVDDTVVDVPDLSNADLENAVLSYDRPSDILLVFLVDRHRPAVAAGGSDHVYALVEPDTDEFLGLQIDDFLTRAVHETPRLINVLHFAELVGMSQEDLRQERQRVLSGRPEIPDQPHPQPHRKQDTLRELLREAHTHFVTGAK